MIRSATFTRPDSTTLDKLTIAGYQHDSDSMVPVHSHEEQVRIELTETSGTGFSEHLREHQPLPGGGTCTPRPKGVYDVTITALNQGPNGSDAVIGTRTVTHQDPTKTTMSLTSSWT